MSIVHSDGACSNELDGKGELFCLAVSISEGQIFNRDTHENKDKILPAYVARAIVLNLVIHPYPHTHIYIMMNISVHTVVLYSTLIYIT